ncbi:hypothetical protein MNBD_DELTA03-235 [hydrothermal vent metagenome]|uniref:Histidine kinase n=1 Tax=hydrothermal vent metagenome TaxID=652676 RepID=A0A3B0VK91_9ZZZZ
MRRSNKDIQTVLSKVMRLAVSQEPFTDILRQFLKILTSLPHLNLINRGVLFLVDEEPPYNLRLRAAHNLSPRFNNLCRRIPLGHCLCGQCAAEGRIILADNSDPRYQKYTEASQSYGHYCIPIPGQNGSVLGVFTLYARLEDHYDPEIVELLQIAAIAIAGIIRLQRSAKKLTNSQHYAKAITNAAIDAIIMMDDRARVTLWNPAATRLFGYSEEEAVGRNVHDLIVPDNYSDAYRPALMSFLKKEPQEILARTVEVDARCRDGREIPVELSLSGVDINGRRHAVGIIRDIRRRRRAEEERMELDRQLQQSWRLEAIGTLAGGIAHDFNNITASVLGFANMALEELPPDSPIRSDLGHIISAGLRAKEITRQILTFSRGQDLHFSPLRLDLMLQETIKLLQASIPAAIKIELHIAQGCQTSIIADPLQIHQILMNLCANSYYAMRRHGGTIDISLRDTTLSEAEAAAIIGLSPGDYIQLSISDTGSGIPPEVLPKIFNPFFTTKPKPEGTGMGLAIVHGIVSKLNGAIQIKSSPGQGTTFIIYIPPCQAEAEPAAPKLPAMGGQERILLVDDEAPLAEITARALNKTGYKVTFKTDSIEALETFKARPDDFDIILTDQTMPNMTGIDLAVELLKIKAHIPIIMFTGIIDQDTMQYAKEIGIRKIILKPMELDKLSAAIQQLCGEG